MTLPSNSQIPIFGSEFLELMTISTFKAMKFGKCNWVGIFVGAALFAMAAGAFAQEAVTENSDPSDIWLSGYLKMREGEEQETGANDLQALAKFREAQKLFDFIARAHPTWKSSMMTFRRKNLTEKILLVQERLEREDPAALADLPNQAPPQAGAPDLGPGRDIRIPPPEAPAAGPAPVPMAPVLPQAAPGTTAGADPVEGMNQHLTQMRNQIDFLSGQNGRLQAESKAKDVSIANLQTQLEEVKKLEDGVKGQLAAALQELGKAQAMGGDEVKRLEAKLKLTTDELGAATAKGLQILAALEKAQAEAAKLAEENLALRNNGQGMAENVAQLAVRMEATEKARDEARKQRDALAEEREQLIATRDALTKERDGLKKMTTSESSALMEELNAVQAQLEAMTDSNTVVSKERDDLSKKLEAELTKNGELSEANQQLLTELQKSREAMEQLDSKVLVLQKERDALKKDNVNLQRERDLLVTERNELQKDLDELAILLNASEQIDGDVKDMVQAKREWQTQLKAARDEAEALAKKEGDYKLEIADLKRQVGAIQKEREALKENNSKYQERVVELNGKLDSMLKEISAKDSKLAEATGQLAVITKERDALQADLKSATGELGDAQKRMESLTAQMTEAEEQVVMLQHSDEENDLLRGIIRRQLVKQTRLQQSRDLVLEELQKLDVQSASLLSNLDSMSGERIDLTEKEIEMFRDPEDLKLIEAIQNMSPIKIPEGTTTGAREADTVIMASRDNEITRLAKAANYDFNQGSFDNAQAGYERILKIDRSNVFALCNLGVIQIRRGNLEEAAIHLERASAHKANCAPAHYYLGVIRYKQQNLDAALTSFGECIALDEGNANAHNYIGLIASEQGWGTRAETEFKKAITVNPTHADAHFNLAVLYATREQPAKDLVEQFYRKAVQNGAERDSAMEEFING